MASKKDGDGRLSFQEIIELVELPSGGVTKTASGTVKRYLGTRAAWLPGSDLFINVQSVPERPPAPNLHKAAFGGHVYAQAALAMCRVMRDAQEKNGLKGSLTLGLHSIHGYFTAAGMPDRPFVYTAAPLTVSPTFSTCSVTAYQPLVPSTNPQRDHFPESDALLPPGPACFTAIASFKSSEPDTGSGTISAAEPPPQHRFASILSSRPPERWPPSPPVDIAMLTALVGTDIVGTFPALDMKKVDMTAYNADKPLHEQRELILYRLLRPLPSDGTDGWDASAHVCAHAYAIDRNGLLMLGNLLGIGDRFGRAASLSYSVVVHVNVEAAVMAGEGWWVQECCFPRAGAGRGIIMSKVWSPGGVHVLTEYQDGLCRTYEERRGTEVKL